MKRVRRLLPLLFASTLLYLAALAVVLLADAYAQELATPTENKASSEPNLAGVRVANSQAASRRPDWAPEGYAVASYTLTVKLNAETHTIKGSGQLHFTNRSATPVKRLWFHLYLNAFKNDETLFLRSPFGTGRSGTRPTDWGWVEVDNLSAPALGGDNLWDEAAKHTPGDPQDETDISVPLPRAIEPGETVTFDIAFTSKLPSVVERTGYSEDYHFAGQWFPKLARLERDGSFVHFPYHPHAEFYSDFGDYDITIDVPANMVVGASGKRISDKQQGKRRQVRHRAFAVHDFAWVAWPEFEQSQRVSEGVAVRILYPPWADAAAERTLDVIERSLPIFNRHYGRYPYPTLTVVHPPTQAQATGGMEYPTLITTGGRWFMPYLGLRGIETVTVHELGHQWFYGLLASNERAAPFLDEGLTSYAEVEVMEALYEKGTAMDSLGAEVSMLALYRVFAAERALDHPVGLAAPEFTDFGSLAGLVYARAAVTVETLARVYGREAVHEFLKEYALRYRFRHPQLRDFTQLAHAKLASEAAKALETILFEVGWVDYEAGAIHATQQRSPGGVYGRGNNRTERAADSGSSWISTALISREGNLSFPVDLELHFQDGHVSHRRWDGRGRRHHVRISGSSPVVRIVVDPQHTVLLDQNLLNNVSTTSSPGAPRVLERATYASQVLLGLLGP